MHAEIQEAEWLDASGTLGPSELAPMCGLSVAELEELVEYGLLRPAGGSPTEPRFSAACVQALRRASAMRDRFDLDLFVLGLIFSQFEHIEQLEQQLRTLHAHRPDPRSLREGPSLWREPHGVTPGRVRPR